jgi:hypothetical protein
VAAPVDPAAVEAEIDLIRSLGLDALRVRWRATFGRTPSAGLTKDIMGGCWLGRFRSRHLVVSIEPR